MTKPERLSACPLLSCDALARSAHVCYGRNGVRRACMLTEGNPLLVWAGDDAWSGPANWYAAEVQSLKEALT